MIPIAYLREWSAHAPWPDLRQVEQDLIISRALCDLFASERLQGRIAFRGGTAIHKLLFSQPLRYSEDIDLVQTQAEPIGQTAHAIGDALAWLGGCSTERAAHSMHFVFRFTPEAEVALSKAQSVYEWAPRFTDQYLYEELGLVKLCAKTKRLPWANT